MAPGTQAGLGNNLEGVMGEVEGSLVNLWLLHADVW